MVQHELKLWFVWFEINAVAAKLASKDVQDDIVQTIIHVACKVKCFWGVSMVLCSNGRCILLETLIYESENWSKSDKHIDVPFCPSYPAYYVT